jgi:hypothetical protein
VPFAHERWFEHEIPGSDWGFAGETLTLVLLAAAVLVTVAVRVLARLEPGVDVPWLARMAPYMPFAIRLHLAVSMVGLLSQGYYLAPSMDLPSNVFGILFGAVMVLVAFTMASGWNARIGALLLIASGPVAMIEFGFWDVLQRVDVLGLAFYVLLTGPGRWSADYELGRAEEPSHDQHAAGVWALKVAAGLALIVVAFAEKLAYPDLGVQFLQDRPHLNVARQIGLDWSNLEFIRVAGSIEVLFGLLLISGALPQAVVIMAGIPFNATLWFFGVNELLGHLPIYGTMLVLLVYGSDPRLRPAVAALAPRARPRPRARGAPAPAHGVELLE